MKAFVIVYHVALAISVTHASSLAQQQQHFDLSQTATDLARRLCSCCPFVCNKFIFSNEFWSRGTFDPERTMTKHHTLHVVVMMPTVSYLAVEIQGPLIFLPPLNHRPLFLTYERTQTSLMCICISSLTQFLSL